MRVNLILSILVFQERKYCLHDNVKLVFFKKKNTKTIHTIKKKKKKPNSASELHCSREQCNLLALFATVQVNLHCLRAQCK